MRLFHEEVFGPVTPVYKFSTDDGEAPPAVCALQLAGVPGCGQASASPSSLQAGAPPAGPCTLLFLRGCHCCLLPFCPAEALQLANDTQYGLAAYFYTRVGGWVGGWMGGWVVHWVGGGRWHYSLQRSWHTASSRSLLPSLSSPSPLTCCLAVCLYCLCLLTCPTLLRSPYPRCCRLPGCRTCRGPGRWLSGWSTGWWGSMRWPSQQR